MDIAGLIPFNLVLDKTTKNKFLVIIASEMAARVAWQNTFRSLLQLRRWGDLEYFTQTVPTGCNKFINYPLPEIMEYNLEDWQQLLNIGVLGDPLRILQGFLDVPEEVTSILEYQQTYRDIWIWLLSQVSEVYVIEAVQIVAALAFTILSEITLPIDPALWSWFHILKNVIRAYQNQTDLADEVYACIDRHQIIVHLSEYYYLMGMADGDGLLQSALQTLSALENGELDPEEKNNNSESSGPELSNVQDLIIR